MNMHPTRRRLLWLALAGLAASARGQVLNPTSGNVTAGNTISFLITGLNTSTALPPTRIYMYSEDPERLWAPGDPVTQPTLFDAATTSSFYQSSLSGVDGLTLVARKRVDGLFSPIRVHFIGVRYGIVWSGYADIVVDHPTFSFHPSAPVLRVGDTVPLVVRRTIEANANLSFRVETAEPAILGLGRQADGLHTNAAVDLEFEVFEISKTLYVSGLASTQQAPLTNILVTARVGSYATNLPVLVSTNAGLILAPASPVVAAGDVLSMSVTRPSPTNVSPLTVLLTSDHPAVLAVPASVTIPAGAQSVNFPAHGLKPGAARVQASAVGVEPGPDSARDVAVGAPTLSFEPSPAMALTGEVRVVALRRPAVEAGGSLTVSLVNDAPALYTLETNVVVLPAGHAAASFSFTGVAPGKATLTAKVGDHAAELPVVIAPASPGLEAVAWRDADGNGAYNAGDYLVVSFNSIMETSTVTLARLELKQFESGLWVASPTGSWGVGSTLTVLDPGINTSFRIDLAGSPALGPHLAVDPSDAVLDVLGRVDGTAPPYPLPGAEADSDNDGLPDWWELLHFGSATGGRADEDPDGDGLTNYWEYRLSADPYDAYSADPGGTLNDGSYDSDGDGLANRDEIDRWLTDPLDPDTDDDGYLDGVEASSLQPEPADAYGVRRRVTSPTDSSSPSIRRSLVLGGLELEAPFGGRFTFPTDPGIPPEAFILEPVDGTQVNVRYATIKGRVSSEAPLSRVRLNNNGRYVSALELDDDGAFEMTIIISSGENEVEVTAVDVDGRTGRAFITIIGNFPASDIRVTQTWSQPGDLDTWLVDPLGRHRGYTAGGPGYPTNTPDVIPGSLLDIDDIPGVGPENITIERGYATNGLYEVWMNNYANRADPESTVRVLVHEGRPDQQYVEFGPKLMPVSDGNGQNPAAWWLATTINWPAGTMSPPGTPVGEPPDDDDDDTGLASQEGWTIEAWLRPGDTNQGGAVASYVQEDGELAFVAGLRANRPFLRVRALDGEWYETTAGALPAGEWSHVAFVYSAAGRSLRLHVNGVLTTALSMMKGRKDLPGRLFVDAADAPPGGAVTNRFTACHLDEVRFWSLARNGGLIADWMHRRVGSKSSLVACYSFDDGGLGIEDGAYPLDRRYDLGGGPLPDLLSDARPGPDGLWGSADDVPAGPGADGHNDHVTAVFFAPVEGAVDSDQDGMPDWWELLYFGSATGALPAADPDEDGLTNLFEYRCETHPREVDTDNDGILDAAEDFDGDGLSNGAEQQYGSDPRLTDTDDDGLPDGVEAAGGGHPADALRPLTDRVLQLDGLPGSQVDLPAARRLALDQWTLMAWVNPSAAAHALLAERTVEPGVTNYALGLAADGRAWVAFNAGDDFSAVALSAPPAHAVSTGAWSHVAGAFDSDEGRLSLYVNGQQVATLVTAKRPASNGRGPGRTRLGAGFAGLMDEAAILNAAIAEPAIRVAMAGLAATGSVGNAAAYFRFDDGTSATNASGSSWHGVSGRADWRRGQVQDFAAGLERDWWLEWRNAATLAGGAALVESPPGAPVHYTSVDADGNGLPDGWEYRYFGGPADADADPDGDGLSNLWEYRLGFDPLSAYSADPSGLLNDGAFDSDGDGLSNREEIELYGTDPLRWDTDDDGVHDGEEVKNDLTHPLHPMSSRLYRERSLNLAAVPAGGLVVPDPSRFHVGTNGWTVECWLHPGADGDGRVFSLEGAGAGPGFRVGLEDHRPKVELFSGGAVIASAGGVGPAGSIQRLPTNEWSHVAWAWGPQDNSLKIFINGVLLIAQETLVAPEFLSGTGVLAQAFGDGYLDDVRLWNYSRSWEEVDYWHRRFYPAPAGYVPQPIYGQSLRLYYRFDDGGSNTVDFAFLNQPAYFLANTEGMVTNQPAVSLLGRDDEDGDLLPEWWGKIHNLLHYPNFQVGPNFEYFDNTAQGLARVSYFRAFTAYGSIGNVVGWSQEEDNVFHMPKDEGLGPDGRHSLFMKYVYLYSVPKTALLQVFTPGMESTIAYVNGQRLTASNQTANAQQSVDIAGQLKIGRNMIYVRCISRFDRWLDLDRAHPVIVPPSIEHFERAIGKFDARLVVDGVDYIVRGDTSRNDPRAVWFVQTWSTFWHMMYGGLADPTAPDLENRFLPGNQNYGLPFDADTDGLNAWYEYLVGTNPRDDDSNNNGIPDGLEDHDGDGVVNRDEQDRGIHPLLPDTDDDGLVDGVEAALGDDPSSARSPAVSRSLSFDGLAGSFVELPIQRRFALEDWTLEAWVRLRPGEADGGLLVQRQVGPNGVNYELGLDGANRPYVRYVSVDGLAVQATGAAPVAAGTNWTHVAGTYDDYRRELKLYVNGAYEAEAPLAVQSPAIYAGGPVLQRIGAGLDGYVDDIRLWSVARSAEELAAAYDRALQGSELNLVAYYRADDQTSYRDAPRIGTSANNGTNGAVNVQPWAWGQVQDYVRAYSGDWWEKWIHAATLRGGAGFSADDQGAIPIPPSLRVSLLPPEAVEAGAQWAALGVGSWQNSGTTLYEDLEAGPQTILFKTIYGWTAPSNRVVELTNGMTTVLTESYVRNGSLRVEISFDDQNNHSSMWPVTGAQWRVTGGIWRDSGETLENMTPGSYVVEFKAIPGWTQPEPAVLVIPAGTAVVLLRQYVPATAAVRVVIEPAVAATMGARWRLDSGPWQTSGSTLYDVTLGGHLVGFNDVSPWVAPSPIALDLTNTNLVTVTGRYEQVTGLFVGITPPQAVAAGAQWRVSGGDWQLPMTLLALPAGAYTVEFKPLAGWGQPADVHTVVTGGFTTVLSADYDPEDPDGDGLTSDWEAYLGSDPYDAYSITGDPNGLNDGEVDSDDDGLSNYEETAIYGTDPLRPDTDDDGVADGEEVRNDLTHPLHPMSGRLYRERSLNLAAVPDGGLGLPDPARFRVRRSGWTLEAWMHPGADGDGEVFRLEGGAGGQRFWVGLKDHRPLVQFLSGTNLMAAAGGVGAEGSIQQLPTNAWSHVAWVWGPTDNSLKIYVNGVLLIAQETLVSPDFSGGTGVLARAWTDGYLDEVRFWQYDRSWEEIDYWNNRFYPAPSGYVREPSYGQSLRLYLRFDDGGEDAEDFASLNQPAYALPSTAALLAEEPAVSLLGRDDEDGDLLPEWWSSLHGLDQYVRINNLGPETVYFDESSTPPNAARVAFYRAAHVYASVGGYYSWLDQDDDLWYSPKDRLLDLDGRYSAFLKYVYLHRPPATATLKVHTPGMVRTIAYVNGVRVTPQGGEDQVLQATNVAALLRPGRNAVYVYCESSYNLYLDAERTILTTDPKDGVWWEGIRGKFDAELVCDGRPVIVRGDHSRNDPRAVWYAQTWSTYLEQLADLPLPDLEMRAAPGNADYGLPFDADSDGLNAWYEYLVNANPRDDDSNNNGIPDGLEDADGDGLVNLGEQERGTHPLLPDTDDDGTVDGAELGRGDDPADAMSPAVSRALALPGGAGDFVELPMQRRFALNHWTVEAWVRLDPAENNGGIILQRTVGPNGVNYELGLGNGAGVGANAPYVRYVSADGFAVQAADTTAVAPGTNWTHVAGAYDGYLRELKLYVNGEYVAAAAEALKSPAIYAGGPVLQRLGAGLNGAVDDVRLWGVARQASDIAASYRKALRGTETNLVAYYRADDGTSYRTNAPVVGTSANNGTNGAAPARPWTWGQVQDGARLYAADWWDHWTHAASLRGRAGFGAAGALPIPPSLRVALLPPEAVTAGAQWAVQGAGSWMNSGATLYEDLGEGTNTVLFRSIPGWTAPSNRVVVLTNGVTTVLTEIYIRNGGLRVDLNFVDEATHGQSWPVTGAQWRVSGGAWRNDGDTVDNLSPGDYVVEFKAIPGWIQPELVGVTVPPGETALLLRQYVPASGTLRVMIEPPGAVAAGARWRLDAGGWNQGGDTLGPVTLGDHVVSFAPLPSYNAPAPIAVPVTNTAPLVITGRYVQVTGLYVDIEPPEAVAEGAQWRIAGGGWTNSGVRLELAPGAYTVQFKSMPVSGFAPDVPTEVTNGSVTFVTGQYYPIEIYGPAGTGHVDLALSLNRPMGLAFDRFRRLHIADSENHRVVILDTRSNTVGALGGQGTGAGQFRQPFSVAVDSANRVYVADAGNHRVQRWTPPSAWTVWGGTNPAAGLGSFNAPMDLAVDARTNLYVADQLNNRIQHCTPAGVWSVAVTNGAADGFVRSARGVAAAPSNTLWVSDHSYSAEGYSRIQRLGTGGVARLGSSAPGEGGLLMPAHLAPGRAGELWAADTGNSRLLRWTEAGGWQTILGDNVLRDPIGVTWDDRGYVYVADTGNHRILRLQVWRSPDLPPVFSQTAPGPSGVVISWRGAAGWFYSVQYTDSLLTPQVWTPVSGGHGLPGVEGLMSIVDAGHTGQPPRVYRVLAY